MLTPLSASSTVTASTIFRVYCSSFLASKLADKLGWLSRQIADVCPFTYSSKTDLRCLEDKELDAGFANGMTRAGLIWGLMDESTRQKVLSNVLYRANPFCDTAVRQISDVCCFTYCRDGP
jgi:hypothetical protein